MSTRILLVEDQHADLFADVLGTRNGLRFEIARDGKEGLDKALAQPFDLILMDLRLPRLPGDEVIKLIRRSDGPNRKTPIVAVTAYDNLKMRTAAMENGADVFVTKPPNFDALYRLVIDMTIAAAPLSEESKRLLTLKRRLSCLKEQQAYMGLNTPPHIKMEIEDIQAVIEEMEAGDNA